MVGRDSMLYASCLLLTYVIASVEVKAVFHDLSSCMMCDMLPMCGYEMVLDASVELSYGLRVLLM